MIRSFLYSFFFTLSFIIVHHNVTETKNSLDRCEKHIEDIKKMDAEMQIYNQYVK